MKTFKTQKYEKIFICRKQRSAKLIDFSKSKFDVSLQDGTNFNNVLHSTFENSSAGYKSLLKWLSKQSKIKRENWRFCGEHTGLYSRGLSGFPAGKGLFVWLENPLQIKRCSGIKRIKTDRYDLQVIAMYACRFVFESSMRDIERIKKQIEGIEKKCMKRS